jgi:hypothetical protein
MRRPVHRRRWASHWRPSARRLSTRYATPEHGTCGWYIWGGGEFPQDPEFFQALHVEHLSEYCAQLLPFLALAPGWRVLLAPGYEDVWYDETLLDA